MTDPYRTASRRSPPADWRVTWFQKFDVKVRRLFGLRPYDAWSQYSRHYRRYEKALARWKRDYGPQYVEHRLAGGGTIGGWVQRVNKGLRAIPPPPCPPPIPIME